MNSLLKFLVWSLRAVVFIALFGLAIKNSGPMELRFFFDQAWIAPIAAVILVVFFAGVVVGLTAAFSVLIPSMRRKKRDKDT